MTLNWATQVSREPVRLGIAVQKEAYTHELLMESENYSLNLLHRDDRGLVRKFVKPVAVDRETMTLNGIGFREGLLSTPILTSALAYLECRIEDRVDTGDHTFFVGDVVNAAFQNEAENAGSERPPVLRMEDTRMNYGG